MIGFSGIPGQPVWPGIVAGPGPKASEPVDKATQIAAMKQMIRTASADDPYNSYFEFSRAISKCEEYAKSDKKGGAELFDYLATAAGSIRDKDTAARFLKAIAGRIPGLELGKTEANDLLVSILARAKSLPLLPEASVVCGVVAVQAAHKLIGKAESDRALAGALIQVRATTVSGHNDYIRKASVLVEIAEVWPTKGIKEKAQKHLLYSEALGVVEQMPSTTSLAVEESFNVSDAVKNLDKKVIDSMKKAGFKNDEIARLFIGRKVGLGTTEVGDYLRTRHTYTP